MAVELDSEASAFFISGKEDLRKLKIGKKASIHDSGDVFFLHPVFPFLEDIGIYFMGNIENKHKCDN